MIDPIVMGISGVFILLFIWWSLGVFDDTEDEVTKKK